MKKAFLLIIVLSILLFSYLALSAGSLTLDMGLNIGRTSDAGGPSGDQAMVDKDGKYMVDKDGKYMLGATP